MTDWRVEEDYDYRTRKRLLICNVCREVFFEIDDKMNSLGKVNDLARRAVKSHRCLRPFDVEKRWKLYRYEGRHLVEWKCSHCHKRVLSAKRPQDGRFSLDRLVLLANLLEERARVHDCSDKEIEHVEDGRKPIRVVRIGR